MRASQLLGYDTKRLHVFHQLMTSSGAEAVTNELMFLHVELATERVTAMPSHRLAVVAALAAEHAELLNEAGARLRDIHRAWEHTAQPPEGRPRRHHHCGQRPPGTGPRP